jgi:hypothetical protein
VTTIPSGTTNVAVTGQPIAVTPANTITTPLFTSAVQNPALTGSYVASFPQVPGVVAANTYLTLFNPVGSSKTVLFGGAFISMVAGSAASTTAPMRGYRIAAAPTGGTVASAASIGKFQTSQPNPAGEIRTGNPTVTLGAGLWNTPPAVTTGAGGGQFIHIVSVPPGAGIFSLIAGEGIAINCSGGDVDQVWNVSVVWSEL